MRNLKFKRQFLVILLFLALAVPYSYFTNNFGTNQASRFDLILATLFEETLSIDDFHDNTLDKSLIEGVYYSNKPPGLALLAFPAAFVVKAYLPLALSDLRDESTRRLAAWLIVCGSVVPITALGGAIFFSLLRATLQHRDALCATLSLFLGVSVFPYATSFFSHSTTIALLTVALWGTLTSSVATPYRAYVAGLSAAFAITNEYNAALACMGLLVFSLFKNPWMVTLRILTGMIPPVSALGLYHYALTGSPFDVPYRYDEISSQMANSALGHEFPTWVALQNLTITEYRGLFFWSPFLLLAFVGWLHLWRTNRPVMLLTSLVSILLLVEVAAFITWEGGWCVGPRYFSPAIPFIGFAAAFGFAAVPRLGRVLALISLALGWITAPIGPMVDASLLRPLWDYYLPQWFAQSFPHNFGHVLGLSGIYSLVPLACVEATILVIIFWLVRTIERSPKPDTGVLEREEQTS